MGNIAIRATNLGKQYTIAATRQRHDTLRDELVASVKRLVRTNGQPKPRTNTIWALRNVSFEVERGEVVGIIGRNGAGKSTLLRILSRITEPTAGRAEIYGRIGSLLEVGTGFHPELTGRENIYLNGAILGMKRTQLDRQFDEIVAFAELEKFIDTPVKRYSSGMYVRLAFAVAAHLEPDILFVDEVLAVGDAAFQKKCLGKMESAAHEGRTILFVSHNMAAVAQLCPRAIWVDSGQVRKDSSADQATLEYMSRSTDQGAERTWTFPGDAPGDDLVRLLAVRLSQGAGATSVVDINQPSRVALEFEVLRGVTNLISGVSLYDAMGTCLFASCDWRPNRLSPGTYGIHADVPPHFLAEGRFNVLAQLVFYDPYIPSVVLPDALSFDAVDSHHPLAVRGRYTGAWPGLVRVRLDWSLPCAIESPRSHESPTYG